MKKIAVKSLIVVLFLSVCMTALTCCGKTEDKTTNKNETTETQGDKTTQGSQTTQTTKKDTFTITVAKNDNAKVVLEDGTDMPSEVESGSTIKFKVTANQGYVIATVRLGTSKLTAVDGVYTITNITENVSISVITAEASVTSLTVTGELTNKTQIDGEELNIDGLTFSAVYDDDSKKELSIEDLTLPVLYVGAETIVSYGDFEVTISNLTIKYSINYELGNVASFKDDYKPATEYLDEAITLPTIDDMEVTYGSGVNAFVGWYTNPECTTEASIDENTTGNLTLYAKWNNFTADATLELVEDVPSLVVRGTINAIKSVDDFAMTVGLSEKIAPVVNEDMTYTITYDLRNLTTVGQWEDLKIYYALEQYNDLSITNVEMSTVLTFKSEENGIETTRDYMFREYNGALKVTFEYNVSAYFNAQVELTTIDGVEYLLVSGEITEIGKANNLQTHIGLVIGKDISTKIAAELNENSFTIKYQLSKLEVLGNWYDINLAYSETSFTSLKVSHAVDYEQTLSNTERVYKFQQFNGDLKVAFEQFVALEYTVTSSELVTIDNNVYLKVLGTFAGCEATDISVKLNDQSDPVYGTAKSDTEFEINVLLPNDLNNDNYVKIGASLDHENVNYKDLKFSSMKSLHAYNNQSVFYTKIWNDTGEGLILTRKDIENNSIVELTTDESGKPILVCNNKEVYIDAETSNGWKKMIGTDGVVDITSEVSNANDKIYMHFGNNGTNLTTANFKELTSITYNGLVYTATLSWDNIVITVTESK